MRFKYPFFVLLFILFSACNEKQHLKSKNGFAVISKPGATESVATFAGGCFWAMQECMLELKGVTKVISGYSGGHKTNPTYDEVLTKTTGHAESVQVYYNPKVITFEKLTTAFFHSHDPTQLDGQGPDIGSDYRSIAFYRSEAERQTILKVINSIASEGKYRNAIVTEITPFKVIYPAEIEHQDYYRKNPWDGYIRNVSRRKVLKLRKEMPDLLKSEYRD